MAGTGHTAGITQAGKKAAAVALGAGSAAAATKPAGGPWWLYGLAGLACVAGGLWLRGRLPF
jgi:hypothetical protein